MQPFGPLIDAAAVPGSGAVVADVRWALGSGADLAGYESGHIPGAVFVDLDRDLSGPGGGRHPLPSPAAFAAAMSRLGIADDTRVVAYDDTGGSIAARLWWMLSVTGHEVALLDGGLQAWGGELEAGPPPDRAAAQFTERPWPASAVVDADAIAAGSSWQLIDARAPERFRGDLEPVDARPGHIPGAVNRPWSGNVDAAGRFRPAAELRARFDDVAEGAVVYCGSGVTACHDALAMVVAGLPLPRLYPGSWSDWSADPSRDAFRG